MGHGGCLSNSIFYPVHKSDLSNISKFPEIELNASDNQVIILGTANWS